MAVLSGCGTNQNNTPSSQDPRSGAKVVIMPKAQEKQTKIDTIRLGKLHEGEVVETGIWLKNTDTKPLVIVSTVTGCGCTTVGYDTKPIAPQDSSYIKIVYNSKNKYGQQIQDIDLISSDNQIAKTILMVEVLDNN